MSISLEKIVTPLLILIIGLAGAASIQAHLPSYEGDRVRNDNHFTKEGFARPVRGECDVNAAGPTDPGAGSANIYLGGGNTPPNFFCAFTAQDDWSFELPLDIIEATRTPSPDPMSLGLDLEEGYISCSPSNLDPFQCPREIADPRQPGQVIRLPGQCVDLGQPGDPAASPDPDGSYHCALLPGAPRPRTSAALFSTLTGRNDVDWAVYRYDPAYAEVPIVAAPQVPACRESIDTFISFAYAGALHLKDARSGKRLFVAVEEAGWLPREIVEKLPSDYGIRVVRPSAYKPSRSRPRPGYASGFGQNAWLLAEDSVVECIDNFEKCLADDSGALSKHYNFNDIFFMNEATTETLYLMWWVDPAKARVRGRRDDDDDDDDDGDWHRGKRNRSSLTDVSITTGVVDQFIVGDFANIGVTGPFSGNGRYIHGACRDPRKTNRVDMIIETNN